MNCTKKKDNMLSLSDSLYASLFQQNRFFDPDTHQLLQKRCAFHLSRKNPPRGILTHMKHLPAFLRERVMACCKPILQHDGDLYANEVFDVLHAMSVLLPISLGIPHVQGYNWDGHWSSACLQEGHEWQVFVQNRNGHWVLYGYRHKWYYMDSLGNPPEDPPPHRPISILTRHPVQMYPHQCGYFVLETVRHWVLYGYYIPVIWSFQQFSRKRHVFFRPPRLKERILIGDIPDE
jgi:hypothetical protein